MNMQGRRRVLKAMALAVASLTTTGLASCGGAWDETGNAEARLVNLTLDIDELQMRTLDEDDEERTPVDSLERDRASDFEDLGNDLDRVEVSVAGTASPLFELGASRFADDEKRTIVVYGYSGRYRSLVIDDEDDSSDDNRTRVFIVNGAEDAGTLDVYLTSADTDLGNVTPTFEDVAPAGGGATGGTGGEGSTGGATEISSSTSETLRSGRYRLRATLAGEPEDLRLDIPEIELPDDGVVTLLLTPTLGGRLVHACVIEHGDDDVQVASNTAVRARLVASLPNATPASAAAGDVSLASNLPSGQLGPYVLVPVASLPFTVTVAGGAVTVPDAQVVAGSDLTVLVHGAAAAPQVSLLNDDNRLPRTSGRAKVRLVNGLGAGVGPLSLSADAQQIASSLGVGEASAPVQVTAAEVDFVVTNAAGTTVGRIDDRTLAAQSVYSVFVLDGGTAPRVAVTLED